MSVLITCALGADAYKFKKQLFDPSIILGDYAEVPDLMIKSGQIIKLPSPSGASYQHEMLTLCLDKGISHVYPLSDMERIALSESDQLFAEYGIIIHNIPHGL